MAGREVVCCMIISCCVVLLCCCPPPTHQTPPSAHNTSSCHQSSAHILQETLLEEDYEYGVKLLPADHQVSAFLLEGETKRLVFPLVAGGPLTITVTPCAFPLSWKLSVRPYHGHAQAHARGAVTARLSRAAENKKIRRPISAVGGNEAPPRLPHLPSRLSTTTNASYSSAGRANPGVRQKGRGGHSTLMVRREVDARPHGRDTHTGRREEAQRRSSEGRREEAVEEQYEGHEPHQVRRRQAAAGLYVLQVHADEGATHVHVLVTCHWTPPPPTSSVTATPTPRGQAVTLRWAGGKRSGAYCLAASEGRPFPSLCAARAALDLARRENKRPQPILGCTENPWYQLPQAPRRRLHVVVWEAGHAGPPLSKGLVPAKPKRSIPRLWPGALLRLVPSAAGTVVAKFRVRRRGRRLHVIAVACGAKLHLQVMGPRGKLLVSAVGNLGALHLAVRNSATPKVLFLRLSTKPTGSARKVILTASYTANALSLPRLPRNARTKVKAITCTSATLRWKAALGTHSYCILLKEVKGGKVWRTRPPRQCGWEAALRQSKKFAAKWCGPPTPVGRQHKTMHSLAPATTYVATVLSRHPVTGRALSYTPVHFTTLSVCLTTNLANTTTNRTV